MFRSVQKTHKLYHFFMKLALWLLSSMAILAGCNTAEPPKSHAQNQARNPVPSATTPNPEPIQQPPAQPDPPPNDAQQASDYLHWIDECDNYLSPPEIASRELAAGRVQTQQFEGGYVPPRSTVRAAYQYIFDQVNQKPSPPGAERLKIEYAHFLQNGLTWLDYAQKEEDHVKDSIGKPINPNSEIDQPQRPNPDKCNTEIEVLSESLHIKPFALRPYILDGPV